MGRRWFADEPPDGPPPNCASRSPHFRGRRSLVPIVTDRRGGIPSRDLWMGATAVAIRLVKASEENVARCADAGVWGSKINRFGNWQEGDQLVFVVGDRLAGLATVIGAPYRSEDPIWADHLYPYRIPIRVDVLLPPDKRPDIRPLQSILRATEGRSWGRLIRDQAPLPPQAAEVALQTLSGRAGTSADEVRQHPTAAEVPERLPRHGKLIPTGDLAFSIPP